MSRMDDFWRRAREIQDDLPPVVYIIHLSDLVVFEAEAAMAAIRIAEGGHRVATAPEIETFKAQQERQRNLAVAQGNAASGRLI